MARRSSIARSITEGKKSERAAPDNQQNLARFNSLNPTSHPNRNLYTNMATTQPLRLQQPDAFQPVCSGPSTGYRRGTTELSCTNVARIANIAARNDKAGSYCPLSF